MRALRFPPSLPPHVIFLSNTSANRYLIGIKFPFSFLTGVAPYFNRRLSHFHLALVCLFWQLFKTT